MKKLVLICTIATFIVACNNDADSDKTDVDTIQPDTTMVPASPDTTKMNTPDTGSTIDTLRK